MTKGDDTIERGADRLDALAGKAAASGAKLAGSTLNVSLSSGMFSR